jgi:hypothetical protein
MTGAMPQAALSLLWTLLAQLPSPHLQESLKALLLLLLHGHGKARPQHSKTMSPSALSRFLNRYPWPTRALIRLVRKEAQEALDRARRRKGPKPRLLVVLDLVTLGKRGPTPLLFPGQVGPPPRGPLPRLRRPPRPLGLPSMAG